jgi:F-type H+-transporting ATPase subunit b
MERTPTRMRRIALIAALALANLAFAASAFASEAAEGSAEGGGVGASALIPKMAEFIPALISFLFVLLILSKFAWPSITSMLDQRAENIRESLEKAEEARMEAERLLEDYKKQMAEARKEASNLLAQARSSADATIAEANAKAQADAEALVEKARVSIEGEKRAAIEELQRSVADLSVQVAGKLIGEHLSPADHEAVIAKYLAEAGSINAN